MPRRCDTQPHRFYGGGDRHARTLSLPLLDQAGHTVRATTRDADGPTFRDASQPYRDDLVVCGACLCGWYGRADLCTEEEIAGVRGHALYRKALPGGKATNDTIDAATIARWLRGGTIPFASVYPQGLRETRDLLRRRRYRVRQRAATRTHLPNTNSPYHLPPFGTKRACAAHRHELPIAERFTDPQRRTNSATDLHLLDACDERIGDRELHRTRTAKVEDPHAQARLPSIPGVGKIRALVLRYASHPIQRCDSAGPLRSYRRRVRCAHASAGKPRGFGGTTIGNAHGRWANAGAAVRFARHRARAFAVAGAPGEEARQGPGAAPAGGAARPHGLPPAPQGRGVRREPFRGQPRTSGGALTYRFLCSVPQCHTPENQIRNDPYESRGRRRAGSGWPSGGTPGASATRSPRRHPAGEHLPWGRPRSLTAPCATVPDLCAWMGPGPGAGLCRPGEELLPTPTAAACRPSGNRTETGPSGSRTRPLDWPERWYVSVAGAWEAKPTPPGRPRHHAVPASNPP